MANNATNSTVDIIACTSVAGGRDDFKHRLVAGFLQYIQKTNKSIVRLVDDNVQQLFSCLEGLTVFGLNGLQISQCESVTLKHLTSNALCIDRR